MSAVGRWGRAAAVGCVICLAVAVPFVALAQGGGFYLESGRYVRYVDVVLTGASDPWGSSVCWYADNAIGASVPDHELDDWGCKYTFVDWTGNVYALIVDTGVYELVSGSETWSGRTVAGESWEGREGRLCFNHGLAPSELEELGCDWEFGYGAASSYFAYTVDAGAGYLEGVVQWLVAPASTPVPSKWEPGLTAVPGGVGTTVNAVMTSEFIKWILGMLVGLGWCVALGLAIQRVAVVIRGVRWDRNVERGVVAAPAPLEGDDLYMGDAVDAAKGAVSVD